MEFKVGDIVLIHQDSEYYIDGDEWNPKHTLGLITSTPSHYDVIVIWANGKTNSYSEVDLIIVEDSDKTVMETLRMIHGL